MNSCYAFYRLPGDTLATRIASHEALVMDSCDALNERSGFVIAPFTPTAEEPVVLIAPDEVSTFVPEIDNNEPFPITVDDMSDTRAAYGQTFVKYHRLLNNGTFRKIVLARQKRVTCGEEIDAQRLFNRACALYPQQMVVLVHTPQSGTWLMATPEILLQGRGDKWRTMALAGTMPADRAEQGWSVKNIREQRLVSTYISNCLNGFATGIDLRGPMTSQAGALVHLKSEFTFALNDKSQVGTLLNALYPTPAVCGIPKAETRAYIAAHETHRSYYSGFMGLLNMDGNTDLYVSLRCMRIDADSCTLYAGGGLISDSVEQQEWDETEAKMGTMLRCLTMQ